MDYKGYENKHENTSRCEIKIYQMDCMELLKQTPDKYYSLCIVDPPYGIDCAKTINIKNESRGFSGLKQKSTPHKNQ